MNRGSDEVAAKASLSDRSCAKALWEDRPEATEANADPAAEIRRSRRFIGSSVD